ncbi:MAG: hypothetical protein FJ304_13885 [Planctomycetes bacterium]|nr:hypothetical protein [Planctomycetota bacterium]
MKTALLCVAVFALTVALMAVTSWLFPKKPEPLKQPEAWPDLHNPDGIVCVAFLCHGFVSIVIVFAAAIVFGFI